MSDAIAGANTIAYILFTVIGVMFYLYKNSNDEKFHSVIAMIKLDREESKGDDAEVKARVDHVDALRVDQITKLHERVGQAEKCIAKQKERISRLEGIQEMSK